MNLETTVSTIHGNILRLARLVEGTWQSSAEVTKDRLTDDRLREEWVYTNNHALHCIERGDAILYFGSKDNSIFRPDTIDEAYRQLTDESTGNYYRPPSRDVTRAKRRSLRLRISDLELKPMSDLGSQFGEEYNHQGYIEIDTSDLTGSKLNKTQRKFAEAVYGSMEQDAEGNSDYSRAMKMISDYGFDVAHIFLLREETVLRDAKDGPIVRACGLDSFGEYSKHFNGHIGFPDFLAHYYGVEISYALRGVEAPQGATPTLCQRIYKRTCNIFGWFKSSQRAKS